jgi:hypothetical protein
MSQRDASPDDIDPSFALVPVSERQLAAALTVIKGQAQLIRRRATRMSELEAEAIVRSAESIDSAVDGLVMALRGKLTGTDGERE